WRDRQDRKGRREDRHSSQDRGVPARKMHVAEKKIEKTKRGTAALNEYKESRQMNTSGRTLKKLSWALAASSLMLGGSVFAQQASISLNSSAVHYCNTVNNQWTIDKTVSPTSTADAPLIAPTSVIWTIQATKNGSP